MSCNYKLDVVVIMNAIPRYHPLREVRSVGNWTNCLIDDTLVSHYDSPKNTTSL